MNRINKLFETQKGNILSVYFTAGFPSLESTIDIIKNLAGSGVEMVEIGIPFSDPLADGPVIQNSSTQALKNGMSLKLLFEQLVCIRKDVKIPLLLMGYLNPVLRFGMDNFCGQCTETGIDGVILPDLPPEVFNAEYSALFTNHHLLNIFLISPHTSEERIKFIDNISRGFIYMVSSSSTTGIKNAFHDDQLSYFKRIKAMNLKNPKLIGFGISNSVTFKIACKMADGAIIGSAFVKMLGESGYNRTNIRRFVNEISGFK